MNWFYMKRGSFRTRSILSEEQLAMMATAGDVGEDDLLMSEQTGMKWVRAHTIPDLLREPEPEPEPQPAPPITPAPQPAKDSHQVKSAMVAVTLTVIAMLAFIVTKNLKAPPEVPPPPATAADPWDTVEADMATLVAKGHIADARTILADYVDAKGENETSTALRKQLATHEKRDKLSTVYSLFIRSAATSDDIEELILLSTELKELDNLKTSLRTVLASKKRPSPTLCLSIIELSKALKDQTLLSLAVNTYAQVSGAFKSEKACLDLIDVYIKCGMTDKVLTTLTTFTEQHPESARIWLELGAQLALANSEEASLEALKRAVKLGGDETRKDARSDPRFESVKETWTFKWNTR